MNKYVLIIVYINDVINSSIKIYYINDFKIIFFRNKYYNVLKNNREFKNLCY